MTYIPASVCIPSFLSSAALDNLSSAMGDRDGWMEGFIYFHFYITCFIYICM